MTAKSNKDSRTVFASMALTSHHRCGAFWCSETDAHWAFDVTRCGLMLWLADQDATELCPVFCNCDDVAAEYMKGLRFERSGTLATGADVCDFRYYRES